MLTAQDMNYISDGFIEEYKVVGRRMSYVPLDTALTKKDKTGKIKFVFKEAEKIEVYGIFTADEISDPDVATDGERRTDGRIKIVLKQLNGYIPRTQDAIDIYLPDSSTERYLVTGFDKRVELDYVFVRVIVTKFDSAFSI